MYNKRNINILKNRFNYIKKHLLLLDNGHIIYVVDMVVTKHKEMVGTGFLKLGKKVEKIRYSFDELHFRHQKTPKGMVSVWVGGYYCSELGMWHLEHAKDKYKDMKGSLNALGFNVVKLPKKKKILK